MRQFRIDLTIHEIPQPTLLWSWENLDKAAYDAYLNTSKFDLKPNGRRVANTNNTDFQSINFPINYETPVCSSGKLQFFVKRDYTNKHCMIRATGFESRWYLPPRVLYRFRKTFDISAFTGWEDVIDAIFWQLHPGSFPDGHARTPPAAVTIRGRDQVFRVRLYGNTGGTTYNHDFSADWPFATGLNTIEIEWLCDPVGESSFVVRMDPGKKATTERVNTSVPFGLMHSAYLEDAYLTLTHGLYINNGSTPIPVIFPSILCDSAHLWKLS
jgi:hypothetical protein